MEPRQLRVSFLRYRPPCFMQQVLSLSWSLLRCLGCLANGSHGSPHFLVFDMGSWDWAQVLMHARQTLYWMGQCLSVFLSHSINDFWATHSWQAQCQWIVLLGWMTSAQSLPSLHCQQPTDLHWEGFLAPWGLFAHKGKRTSITAVAGETLYALF